MKRQYLGDEKDAFKWDYHNFLAKELGVNVMRVLFMLTGNDSQNPNHGGSPAENFKGGDDGICDLCRELKARKDAGSSFYDLINGIPARMDGRYAVCIHDRDDSFGDSTREEYFASFAGGGKNELVFVDPNIGFEPKTKPATCGHVCYSDVKALLCKMECDSVISVYQSWKHRENFCETFRGICQNMGGKTPMAGIHWSNKLMFVALCKSDKIIEKVARINEDYKNKINAKTGCESVGLIFPR